MGGKITREMTSSRGGPIRADLGVQNFFCNPGTPIPGLYNPGTPLPGLYNPCTPRQGVPLFGAAWSWRGLEGAAANGGSCSWWMEGASGEPILCGGGWKGMECIGEDAGATWFCLVGDGGAGWSWSWWQLAAKSWSEVQGTSVLRQK